jgi:hypothetical protein
MNNDSTATWPFDQPPNCMAVTTRQVVERIEPILFVYHEVDDDSWQYIGSSGFCMKDALLVLMKNVVKLDPTVLEVADLNPGWQAIRKFVGDAWIRSEQEPCPDEEL